MNNSTIITAVTVLVIIAVILYVIKYHKIDGIFHSQEGFSNSGAVSGFDPMSSNYAPVTSGVRKYESLVYDPTTGTIMTGSEFMDVTNIITPPWIAPAWNPNEIGPVASESGNYNIDDYENDSRMLYNRCSLSCCSDQYPTPFDWADKNIINGKQKGKYLSSNYTCTSGTAGSGCLCMSPKQIENTR